MKRLIRPLALVMTLVMVILLFPVSAHAEGTLNSIQSISVSLNESNNSATIYVTFAAPVTQTTLHWTNPPISILEIPDEDIQNGYLLTDGSISFTKEFYVTAGAYDEKARIAFALSSTIDNSVDTSSKETSFSVYWGEDRPIWDGTIDKGDLNYQTPYDIALLPTPIAKDDKNGNVDLQLHLTYQGSKNFSDAALSYFRIEPVISAADFPFELELSSYAQTMADLVVDLNEEKEVVATHFDFPFKVKKDAVNGYYPITFKVHHLYQNTNLQETTPVETLLTTYVEIRNGKNATEQTPDLNPDPSTAILLFEGYTVEPQTIKAGDEFDLTLKLRNTSSQTVTDVKSTLTEANSTVLPVSGTSSFFIERVKAGETVEKTIRMKANASAGVRPVEFTLENAFVQENLGKTSRDTFILPVVQVSNLSMDPPSYPTETYAGESFNLMMSMYNKGKTMLYNVSVRLESDFMTADESYYAGNMDSGTSKTYDVMVTPNMEASGDITADIVVTFEDSEGNVTEKRTPITLNVAVMDWMIDEPIYEDIPMEEPQPQGLPLWGWILIAGGGVGVIAAVVILIVVLKKRKNAQEEFDEMD